VKLDQLPFDPQVFEANARRRVALGLIIGELARAEKLQPKPAEVLPETTITTPLPPTLPAPPPVPPPVSAPLEAPPPTAPAPTPGL